MSTETIAEPEAITNWKCLDPRNPQHAELMKNIQGNILKGHGRDHTANIFLEFKNDSWLDEKKKTVVAKSKITELKKYLAELAKEKVTSCYAQLTEREVFKRNKIPGGLNMFMFFTKKGLEKIGAKNVSHLDDDAFIAGMKGRKDELKDPEANTWDGGFKPTKDDENIEIHCMVLLADADENRLCTVAKGIINKLTDDENDNLNPLATILTVEYGHAIRNANGDGLEHNGYVDGISQPLFLKDEIEEYAKFHNLEVDPKGQLVQPAFDPVFKIGQVLIEDPLAANLKGDEIKNAYGSYFVFRKLGQNVRKFKQDEKNIGKSLFTAEDKEDRERIGGGLVGRFEDGTPIEVQLEEGLYGSGVFNNFKYPDDPSDGKCPYFAHVRITNPRTDDSRIEVMARRGIPFGRRDVNTETDPIPEQMPEGGVGLLFMSYQITIVDQFEAIQKRANSHDTPGKIHIDPVIGQSGGISGGAYDFPASWASNPSVKPPKLCPPFVFSNHTTMKGGEYFFAPSMPFLQSL